MDPGDHGKNGQSVPRPVGEEPRPGGDSVTVRPQTTVVVTVGGMTLNRDSATLTNVTYQVEPLVNQKYI